MPVYQLLFLTTLLVQNGFISGNSTIQPTTEIVNTEKTTEVATNNTSDTTNTNHPNTDNSEDLLDLRYVCGFSFELYKQVNNSVEDPRQPTMRLGAVCCPGFKRNGTNCVPHCEGGCGEGVCKYPGVCRCEKKFQYCNFGNFSRPKSGEFKNLSCSENCKNGTCLINNTCQCNPGFRKVDDWTKRYTDSPQECVRYCFPFCSNKPFSSPEECECLYNNDDDDSIELDFDKPKSFKTLQKQFIKYDHPEFGTVVALGSAAGYLIGSNGKIKPGQINPGFNMGSGGNTHDIHGINVNSMYHSSLPVIPGNNNIGSIGSGTGTNVNRSPGWVISGNNGGSIGSDTGTNVNRPPGWVIPGNNYSPGTGTNVNRPSSWVIPGNNGGSIGSDTGTNVNRQSGWVISGNNNSPGTGTNVNRSPGWVIPGNNDLGSSSSGTGSTGNIPHGGVNHDNTGSSERGSSNAGSGSSSRRRGSRRRGRRG